MARSKLLISIMPNLKLRGAVHTFVTLRLISRELGQQIGRNVSSMYIQVVLR